VREALNLATDKRRILKEVFSQRGKIIESPFLDEIFEFKQGKSEYNLEKAKEILEKAGFYLNEEGIRQKEVKEERRFEKELKIGSLGNEVKSLQECLKKEGVFFGKVNGIFDREVKEALILFQQKYAEDILKPSGLKKATGKMGELTIKKLNEVCFERKPPILLKFKILTLKDEKFEKIANILKEDWEKLGVKVEIETIDINSLKSDILAKKNYDAILLGQAFGAILDPYYFWHSSQKEEFGLNLSKFEKKELDEILEKLRENFNENQRKELLEKAKEIILNERPAIFLISPKYCYFLNEKVKGVKESIILNGAQRFENITDWYIKERKVFSK
jgi:ABC-type transport system substrate-binding protein